VQFTDAAPRALTADELAAVLKPRGHLLFPPTTLVEVEDTQNRMGGLVWDRASSRRRAAAREHGAASYLDGARLLNARPPAATTPAALAAPFDLVSIALSKGLGCPGGSVLAGTREDIAALVRYRRMLGGAMRQAGVLAAAGLYALEHHVERLPRTTRTRARSASASPAVDGVRSTSTRLETQHRRLPPRRGRARRARPSSRARGARRARDGLRPRTVRAVTHLDVSADDCAAAADVLAESCA
jgi:threonine aldolase